MKKGKHIFLALLLALLLPQCSYAHRPDGLNTGVRFSSYKVAPERRTELLIPAGKSSVKVKDTLSLSYKLRFVPNQEHFGYISRMIFSDNRSVDVILVNPVGGVPYISFVYDGAEFASCRFPSRDDFMDVSIDYSSSGACIAVSAGGEVLSSVDVKDTPHTVRISFGACSWPGFLTKDCAPMVIKDISFVWAKNRRSEWPLDFVHKSQVIKDKSGYLKCELKNAGWEILRHCRWEKTDSLEFPSKVFPVLNPNTSSVFFVGGDFVYECGLGRVRSRNFHTANKVDVSRLTNTFAPARRGLMYYDIQNAAIRRFFTAEGDWDAPIVRGTHSPYLMGNLYYDRKNSTITHLFGYGFHRYSNSIYTFDLKTGSIEDNASGLIAPRYMAGVGARHRKLLIYGGVGNASGRQELGTAVFHDLFLYDLNSRTVEKLPLEPDLGNEVPARSLIVTDSTFLSLFFNPSGSKAELQLKRISLATGKAEALANPIPFIFHDTSSHADIMQDPVSGIFYAVVLSKSESAYKADIWSLASPVLSLSYVEADTDSHVWYAVAAAILLALAAAAALAYVLRKKRAGNTDAVQTDEIPAAPQAEDAGEPEPDTAAPGIYMLGGFKAIDRNGEDITRSFTPVMKQLLSLIILYSTDSNGISNEEMRDALWADKSRDSFFNNRSVNVRKIRLALEQIGGQNISSNETFWYFIEADNAQCDYINAMRRLRATDADKASREDMECLIGIAAKGTLLSFIQVDYFDQFKSAYSDMMIAALSKMRDSETAVADLSLRKRLCDAILVFDSVDENTVYIKCMCLMSMKRAGVAKSVFDNFTKEYSRMMAEDYPDSFADFIKNKR